MIPHAAHLDFETMSPFDLKEGGLDGYVNDALTRIAAVGASFGDEEPQVAEAMFDKDGNLVLCGSRHLDRFLDHVRHERPVYAHNAQFELAVWNYVGQRLYGWPPLHPEQMHCTMVMSFAMGLPPALDSAAPALGIKIAKDSEGHRVMRQISKPRKVHPPGAWPKKINPDSAYQLAPDGSTIEWWACPVKWAKLFSYCAQDVRVEHALTGRLVPLSEVERRLWVIDQRINARGIRVDVPAVTHALTVVAEEQQRLDAEMRTATNGAVDACTNAKALASWVNIRGCETPGVAKDAVIALLDDPSIPADVRTALELRQEAGKSSLAKLGKMLAMLGPQDRIRYLFAFHAATTGRWGGRGVQPQNFPRPAKWAKRAVQMQILELLRTANADATLLRAIYDRNPMDVLVSCMRAFLVPTEGHDFIASDFSNIEGRVLAWLAGEQWVLDAFVAADEGTGPGIYELAYSRAFGVPIEEVDGDRRQIGKVSELACIAEGQLVLTDIGLVPIEQVTRGHRVWDGLEFVEHDGVIFRGRKPVIEYQGLRATEDHVVWTQEHGPCLFGVASHSYARLVVSGHGQYAIRLGSDKPAGKEVDAGLADADRLRRMHGLRSVEMARLLQPRQRRDEGLPGVLATSATSTVAEQAPDGSQATLHEPWLAELRAARNRVSVQQRVGSGPVDDGVLRLSRQGDGDRPNRRERPLRAGQPSMGDPQGELRESPMYGFDRVEPAGVAVHEPRDGDAQVEFRNVEERGFRGSVGRGVSQAEELACYPRSPAGVREVVKTYDILNAGPRHRFTVSGVLVHNCGFQGGPGAFEAMGRVYNVHLPRKQAAEVVRLWRLARPKTVQFWRDLEQAAVNAVLKPGVTFRAGHEDRPCAYKVSGSFLWCRLPSGRVLCYPYPRIMALTRDYEVEVHAKGEDGALLYDAAGEPVIEIKRKKVTKPQLTFMAVPGDDPKSRSRIIDDPANTFGWARHATYGGSLAENVVQAAARDDLSDIILRAEARGWPVVLHAHDEIVVEVPSNAPPEMLREVEREMSLVPAWAKGLPLHCKGWRGTRYGKD